MNKVRAYRYITTDELKAAAKQGTVEAALAVMSHLLLEAVGSASPKVGKRLKALAHKCLSHLPVKTQKRYTDHKFLDQQIRMYLHSTLDKLLHADEADYIKGLTKFGVDPKMVKEAVALIEQSEKPVVVDKTPADVKEVMAKALTKEKRDKLPAKDFALPKERRLPIFDENHLRLAWTQIGRTQGLSDTQRSNARKAILKRAKAAGIDTSDWTK